ncbi:MAG: VacJ family lipoprotein [Betaproteobacteria bacterium]|nr:VacJ family lipoprotein [Betaproteobacteria bacterium]
MSLLAVRWRFSVAGIVMCMTLLGGCASTGNPRDPFEPLNRGIYHFNDGVDTAVLRPIAEVYRGVLPQFVRTGVSNFFSNINDVIVALNNLLQGKFLNAVSDVGRIVVNSTAGLLGVIDVATEIGLEKHNEDFGQTLGFWGIESGPFVMLPILGPSSARDAVGLLVDFKTDPVTYVDPSRDRNILWGARFVNRRAELLDTSKILETAALDPYEFLRDAYLQRRRNLVHDGSPPPEKDDEPEIKIKPRGAAPDESPFPTSGNAESPVRSVWTSGDAADTPAREAARRTEPAPAAQPRVDAAPAQPRVVRIWTSEPWQR